MKSEARLSTLEAVSMIVGNSIGTGIIAVPYLARKNSLLDVFILAIVAYIINVILHLIIAELSYNNGGKQLVKSFEGELFNGRFKAVFSWGLFLIYGIAIMLGIAGNINGGAQIFASWFGIPISLAQIGYYFIAGIVVFKGMKAVGIAQKYSVIILIFIVFTITIGTLFHGIQFTDSESFHLNNFIALYSMILFATSANQAVIQCVKGLNGDIKKIRFSIFTGFAISTLFVLLVTSTVILGTSGSIDKEMAYLELGRNIGTWAYILVGLFSLFALLTTFWSQSLTLRDVVYEQTSLGYKTSWLIATIPCILFSVFGVNSFILLTRIMSGIVVLLSIMLIITYGKSRKRVGESKICGIYGGVFFRILIMAATIISAIGAVIKLS